MMVRIVDAAEASQAAAAGIDGVEVDLPGASDLDILREIRGAFPGTIRLMCDKAPSREDIAAGAPVDEIAMIVDAIPATGLSVPNVAAVAILSDGQSLDAIGGIHGRVGTVMLDTGHARLVDKVGIARLDAFASACRAAHLPFGLAGGLEAPDVARLLLLEPDVLGFDIAVRRGHSTDGSLDPEALDTIRALIPRAGAALLVRHPIETVTDRVFVRDFAISLAIGAYQAEHGTRQRVRFSVDADVLRSPVPPHDMRDVFSYDIIIETIRVLSQRPHVTFVETLAEEVAAALLTHADLVGVTVKVEKLDVIDASVGIEITRRRPSP